MKWLLSLLCAGSCFAQVGLRSPAFVANLHPTASSGTGDSLTNGILAAWPMDRLPARELISGSTATTSGTDISIVHVNQDTLVGGFYNPQVGRALSGGTTSSGHKLSIASTSGLRMPTNGGTISVWFHRIGLALPGNYPQFAAQNDAFSGGFSGFGLGYGTGIGFRFYVGDGSTYTSVISSTATPNADTWHQLVGVYDYTNSKLRIYMDGTTEDTVSYSGGMATNSAAFTLFGNSTDTDNAWGGMLDEAILYNRALTSNEVYTLYTRGLKGKQAPYFNNTNYIVAIMGSARTLYPESFPAVVQALQPLSWCSNHEAFIYGSHQSAGQGSNAAVAMYIAATGDTNFPIPFAYQSTNLQRFMGTGTNTGTNMIVIFMTGENDVISLNNSYTNWLNLPQPGFTITDVCTTLTNTFELMWNAGIYGLITHTVPFFSGMVDAETNNMNTLNTYLTNYTRVSAFGASTRADFDYTLYGNDFETDPGHTNWCLTNNILLNNAFPNAGYP